MKPIRIAQVGFGMFGSHEVARSLESIVKFGLAPYLGRTGYACLARDLADVRFEIVAVGTRSSESAERAASQICDSTGNHPEAFHGDKTWEEIIDRIKPDILSVATPDDKHYEPTKYALSKGVHTFVQKPLSLKVSEAIDLVRIAEKNGVILGCDLHKEFDPDHIFIARELLPKAGTINYGRAYLEEPLEVSTSTFKWVSEAGKKGRALPTPFGYVGIHWVSLIQNLYGRDENGNLLFRPVRVSGNGQKSLLLNKFCIDALDSTVVDVVYDNGSKITYENNWITPEQFAGITVNQGHELVCTNGKIESDQQNRGLVYWFGKNGPMGEKAALSQRTSNTHFFRKTYSLHNKKHESFTGYELDSVVTSLAAVARMMKFDASLEEVRRTYIEGSSQILPTAVIEAGNASIWKNRELLENGESPSAFCKIDSDKGIELNYISDGKLVVEDIFEGKLY